MYIPLEIIFYAALGLWFWTCVIPATEEYLECTRELREHRRRELAERRWQKHLKQQFDDLNRKPNARALRHGQQISKLLYR